MICGAEKFARKTRKLQNLWILFGWVVKGYPFLMCGCWLWELIFKLVFGEGVKWCGRIVCPQKWFKVK